MLLREFLDEVYVPRRLRDASENTIRLYGHTLTSFGRFLGRPATLSDFDDITLSRYLVQRRRVCSPYTAEKDRNQLLALWRYANRLNLVSTWPDVPPVKLPRKTPEAWSPEDLSNVLRSCRETQGTISGRPAGRWFSCLVRTLWETAERINAVLELRPADKRDSTLIFRAETRKGGREERICQISRELSSEIDVISGKANLFEWDRAKTHLWVYFRKIIKRAGLPDGRCGFHAIRRSAASHYEAAGGDATKLLGHSSRRTTVQWYLDTRVTEADTPKPFEMLPEVK